MALTPTFHTESGVISSGTYTPIASESTVTNRHSLRSLFVAVCLLLYLFMCCARRRCCDSDLAGQHPWERVWRLFLEWVYFKDFFFLEIDFFLPLSLYFSLICSLPLSVWTGFFYLISRRSPLYLLPCFIIFFFVCPPSRRIGSSLTLITP